ncbi:MAG: patatin-like phospholipase family protein [Solirubrobacteraceae bacterium]|nr:patatin-like phospholipase family protein [Solirubrobacteraceae bacterium]
MGKVVTIDRASQDRAGTAKGQARRRRGTPRRSKIGLVLGGGGFTGGVYEIGALRALDLLAVNRTVNEFDVYVGTSAGSFVAALTANGITPEEMMRVVNRQGPAPFRDIDAGTVMRPNLLDFAKTGLLLPWRLARIVRELAPHWRHISAMDVALGLTGDLPSGIYSGAGVERYVRNVLSDPDRTDDFRALDHELYLAATDLDTCERIVFGADGWDDVPISTAVRASTALPIVYKPVRVHDRELVDGGVISTTNVDIAVHAGAKLIVVVNPLVPYVNDFTRDVSTPLGSRPRHVSDMGIARIGYQAFKLLAYQRLHEMSRHWQDKYPDVDIVLIEPEPDDELMFQTSIMDFTKRIAIARHGFQSVTLRLAEDYESYKEILGRHGIEISATRVSQVVKHVTRERERTRAWRRILEQTTSTLLRQAASESVDGVDEPAGSSKGSG